MTLEALIMVAVNLSTLLGKNITLYPKGRHGEWITICPNTSVTRYWYRTNKSQMYEDSLENFIKHLRTYKDLQECWIVADWDMDRIKEARDAILNFLKIYKGGNK